MGIVGRLLVLLAVLFMPIGMESAAVSAPVSHQAMNAAMPMEHCPDQSNNHDHKGRLATCWFVCGSTLPAQEQARMELIQTVCEPTPPPIAPALHGVQLEIATPPPKLT